MATLKEDLNSFFELTGVSDADSARTVISQWRERAQVADTNSSANDQLNEIFGAFGVTDHQTAIDRINAMRAEVSAIHTALGVNDQPSAIAAINNFRTEHGNFISRIGQLEESQKDFDSRVNQEVINRAASAGMPAPIPKEQPKPHGSENRLPRADFEALPAGQRMKFIQQGGRLID